jgi:hypothetical protein
MKNCLNPDGQDERIYRIKTNNPNNNGGYMKRVKITLAVGFVLAMAFIFSCSSDDGGGNSGGSSNVVFCKTESGCSQIPLDACILLNGSTVSSCQTGGNVSCQTQSGCFQLDFNTCLNSGGRVVESCQGGGGNSSSSGSGGYGNNYVTCQIPYLGCYKDVLLSQCNSQGGTAVSSCQRTYCVSGNYTIGGQGPYNDEYCYEVPRSAMCRGAEDFSDSCPLTYNKSPKACLFRGYNDYCYLIGNFNAAYYNTESACRSDDGTVMDYGECVRTYEDNY